jgi:hypothetical protein
MNVVKVFGFVDVSLGLKGHVPRSRFYVLDWLVCDVLLDVLLGDYTLENLDVFNKHVESFIDLEEANEVDDFYMIE